MSQPPPPHPPLDVTRRYPRHPGMAYRFTAQREDYSALASGHVLYSAPGQTAFPVRLASEIFQRCAAHLANHGVSPPYTLYDPCCGSGQLLATLGFLHGDALAEVVGSDVDPQALRLAEQNLALLTPAGLERRLDQLISLHDHYQKESHVAALTAARSLQARLAAHSAPLILRTFQADATNPDALAPNLAPQSLHLIIVDVPYGHHSSWTTTTPPSESDDPPTNQLLTALHPLLLPGGVLAIATPKVAAPNHQHYRRLNRLRIGKRQVTLLTPHLGP